MRHLAALDHQNTIGLFDSATVLGLLSSANEDRSRPIRWIPDCQTPILVDVPSYAKPLGLCKNAKFGPSNAKFAKMHKSNAKLLESIFLGFWQILRMQSLIA